VHYFPCKQFDKNAVKASDEQINLQKYHTKKNNDRQGAEHENTRSYSKEQGLTMQDLVMKDISCNEITK